MADTQYFGDREMTFKKEANCLIGHCRVSFKDEDKVIDYLFTENGYELMSEIPMKLTPAGYSNSGM